MRKGFGILIVIVLIIWIIAELNLEAVVGWILAIAIILYGIYCIITNK